MAGKIRASLQGAFYSAAVRHGEHKAGDAVSYHDDIWYGYTHRYIEEKEQMKINSDNPIADFGNLYRGLQSCKRGVTWKDGVAIYSSNALKNTYKLRQELINGTYKIKPYQYFTVTDPKRRDVMATSIRDRQFQRSLCDTYLYEAITKSFIRDNYACQQGKGMDDALERMDAMLHRYYREHGSNDGWVLKCDIHHYFAETPHDVAKAAVRKRIKDEDACAAVEQIIDSFGDKGIGLGSQVSQLIELAVLDDMDHFIKEKLRIKYYLRYMDDFILIHPDKDYLRYCLDEITKHLAARDLSLNKKTSIFPIKQGITFLKWRFALTDTGKVVARISKASIKRERRKLRRLKPLVDSRRRTIEDVARSFMSWAASAERKRAKNNTAKRRQGKRAWKGYNAAYVEKMRDYFKELYGIDPYSIV